MRQHDTGRMSREPAAGASPGRLYGIQEIADAVGASPRLVASWRQRGSHGLPEPDARLASGAVWFAETIEPWMERLREVRKPDRREEAEELIRRLARRAFRLAAALNEEPPLRAGTIHHWAARLGELDEPLRALLDRSATLGGLAPSARKALYSLSFTIAELARRAEVVPRALRASRDRTLLAPSTEADLLALREVVSSQLLPGLVEALRLLDLQATRTGAPPARQRS